MACKTARKNRLGSTVLSLLVPIIVAALFDAWWAGGLDEAARQQEAIEQWRSIGVSATTDAEPGGSDVRRWWSSKWLYATPWWKSRRWLAAMSGAERWFGTVVDVDFSNSEISDAYWERICTSFASARSVSLSCAVKDDQLRFLRRMRNLAEILIVNAQDEPFIEGQGLRHLKGVRTLTCLGLIRVRLNDAGRKALADLEYLLHFEMTGEVDDDIMERLSHLKRLESITVSEAKITDAGLSHLRNMRSLVSVWLWDAEITDEGLRHLAGLRLRMLGLEGSAVTDRGISYLTGLRELNGLNLANTDVSDAAIPSLLTLKKLEWIDMCGTRVSAAGCKRLFDSLPNLQDVATADSGWLTRDRAIGR